MSFTIQLVLKQSMRRTRQRCRSLPMGQVALGGLCATVFVFGCSAAPSAPDPEPAPVLAPVAFPISLRLLLEPKASAKGDAGLRVTTRLVRPTWAAPSPIEDNDQLEVVVENITQIPRTVGLSGVSTIRFGPDVYFVPILSGPECEPQEKCRRTSGASSSRLPDDYRVLAPGASIVVGRLAIRRTSTGDYSGTPEFVKHDGPTGAYYRGSSFPFGHYEMPARSHVFHPIYLVVEHLVPEDLGDMPRPWTGQVVGPTYELKLP